MRIKADAIPSNRPALDTEVPSACRSQARNRTRDPGGMEGAVTPPGATTTLMDPAEKRSRCTLYHSSVEINL